MAIDRVLIIACGALAHELVRIKKLNRWAHVDIQCLPAELHNYPQKITPAVRDKINANRDRYKKIFIGYGDCGTGGLLDKLIAQEGVSRLPGAHCYSFFAGEDVFNKIHEAEIGTFYLTDYLAKNFTRLIVEEFGVGKHPEIKEMMFGNYKKVVYLAQTDDPQIEQAARAAAEFLALDYERVFTGDAKLANELRVAVGH